MKCILFFLSLIIFNSCEKDGPIIKNEPRKVFKEVPQIKYSVAGQFPHDTSSFTEGLVYHNNKLFESTGSPDELPHTKSLFGILNMQTGKIDKKVEIDRKIYFGEGIVFLNGKIFQLTYENQICFIYNEKDFKKIGQFNYPNKEGWGLTTDGINIIMSDGTNNLTYIDPSSYKVVKTVPVVDPNNNPVLYLNELEYIRGFIYANVYGTHDIVKIDPAGGKVAGKLDLGHLSYQARLKNPNSFEMNGIAYDSSSNKVYVTGKMWPYVFQIDFVH